MHANRAIFLCVSILTRDNDEISVCMPVVCLSSRYSIVPKQMHIASKKCSLRDREHHSSYVTFACGRLRRPAVRRKLEEACWRRIHALCPRWRWRRTPQTPLARKPNPNLRQRPPRALFCLRLDNCCYARYSCGNRVQVFFDAFYFRSTERVHRE